MNFTIFGEIPSVLYRKENMTVSLMKYYPPPRCDRRLEFAVRHRDLPLGRKRVILNALERLDRLIDDLPEDFPFEDKIAPLLQRDLEFFPSRPQLAPDDVVPPDHTKVGHAVETMQLLLKLPEISEDQIRCLQATCYLRFPYREAEDYRTVEVYRKRDGRNCWAVSWNKVPGLMKELVEWVNSPAAHALHPFLRAALFYARYDQVHPFENGTKMVGRFMLDRILLEGEGGRHYPPLLSSQDLNSLVIIRLPQGEWQKSIMDSHALIEQGRTTEFILQLLCLYVSNLRQFFYRERDRQEITGGLADLIRLLKPEIRDVFELNPL